MLKKLLALLIITASFNLAQTIHEVTVSDNVFTPASLTVLVGDQVRWTLSEGSHTTTSSSVPAGAATWDYTFTGPGNTFTYNVTAPGSYNYSCTFHPGMDGSFTAVSSLPVFEVFNYTVGSLLTDNGGWANHSGTGNNITIASGPLTYSGYPSSGSGNHVVIEGGSGSREDVNIGFDSVSADGESVYFAFLANVASASATADYFVHIGNRAAPNSFSSFAARVFVQDAAGSLKFGISNTSTSTIGPNSFAYGTTYLLIVKYTINTTGADDVKLWVLSSGVPADEASAGTPEVTNTTTNGQDIIDAFALRQGGQAYSVQVDGIRIGLAWSDAVPVELTSFTASVSNNAVVLNWATATEINNQGFNVERKSSNSSWQKIGYVQGNGTTTEAQKYSFTDAGLTTGKYQYRLKQIDFDGTSEYSKVVEVDFAAPVAYGLSQNYPNPFNPSTKIQFSVPQSGKVVIKLYNMLGQELKTLLNETREAGIHTIDFNASQLHSGVYFYKIEAGSFSSIKKMTLIK